MAARRLISVLVVLLVFSTVLAALMPAGTEDDREPVDTEPETAQETAARGESISATIRATAKRKETVRVHVGDQLTLGVYVQEPDLVEIDGVGDLIEADRYAPAIFDFVPFEPRTHRIRLVEANRVIGRIEVAPRASGSRRRAGRSGDTSKSR